MADPFQLNPDESILYRSQPSRKWYTLLWRTGLELVEAAVFILFSFTALASLANVILVKFLPAGTAELASGIIFKYIVPVLVITWLIEDTAKIFTSDFILTNQRIWTKGSPYAWTPAWDTPLSNIRSMTFHRDALFIRLKSTRKTLVHVLGDGKKIVETFTRFTGKTDAE